MNRFLQYYEDYYTDPARVKRMQRLEYLTQKYKAMRNNNYKKVIPLLQPRSVFTKKNN